MSTTLARYEPRALASHAGFATAMQTLEGCVSAFFALEGYDRRTGVATYALRVVNRTRCALVCRTWVLSRSGDAVLAHAILVEIAPLSTTTTQVPVCPRDFDSFHRAVAEIAGDGIHCIVEAPAPSPARPRTLATVALASTGAGLVALVAAAVLSALSPRIAAFAVPPETVAGTTIRAEYQASGAGRLSYAVLAPDGRQIQGGTLRQNAGSLPVPIPPSNQPGAYTLQLAMKGPLGTATQTRVLNALVGHGGGAQIGAISVKPLVARPGETVEVAYTATGDGGYVQLVGSDGTVWRQQPFSHSGQAQFIVPPASGPRDMRVLLHVTRGRSAAQSMAGLVVAPQAPSLGSSVPQVIADDNPNTPPAAGSDDNGVFQVLDASVKSGALIHVRVLSPRNGMSIALTDPQSHAVANVAVGSEADVVTLKAPTVTAPTRYTVVASFTDGFGQESVVAPVLIVP